MAELPTGFQNPFCFRQFDLRTLPLKYVHDCLPFPHSALEFYEYFRTIMCLPYMNDFIRLTDRLKEDLERFNSGTCNRAMEHLPLLDDMCDIFNDGIALPD